MKSLYQLLECPMQANISNSEIDQFNDSLIRELSINCPLSEFHPECPFRFLHRMPFQDQANYINNISIKDKQELIDEHNRLLSIEEKDIFGKIFLK
ncbi:MAG: hypothetical protein JEY97_08845 [Bacteroidales bacterium]|nr:hypothetical protein [Bacteroidales bacterium]